jgi:hypothetical protein
VVFARLVSDLLKGKYAEELGNVTVGDETPGALIEEGKVA